MANLCAAIERGDGRCSIDLLHLGHSIRNGIVNCLKASDAAAPRIYSDVLKAADPEAFRMGQANDRHRGEMS